MTVNDAIDRIGHGASYGDCWPLLATEAEQMHLKDWFLANPHVPVRRTRPAARSRHPEATGDLCQCGGLLVRTGSCKTCQSCGFNEGCG